MTPRSEALRHNRDIFADTVSYVLRAQFAAQSAIQRNVRIGHVKAGLMLVLLEEWGIVEPAKGSRARDVLVPKEGLEGILSEVRGGDTTP